MGLGGEVQGQVGILLLLAMIMAGESLSPLPLIACVMSWGGALYGGGVRCM